MENKLTIKQERFCMEYLKSGNATDAAIKAGYSEKTAYSIGQRLLKNVEINQIIESERKKAIKEVKTSFVYSFEVGVEMLKQIYDDADSSGAVKVNVIKELNSMYGFNKSETKPTEPEKPENITFVND